MNHDEKSVPERLVLAPFTPSPKMLDSAVAFALNVKLGGAYGWSSYMRHLWTIMIGSAPVVLDRIDRYQWIPVTERTPQRNTTAIYWHKYRNGPVEGVSGFPCIADEWRDEDHLRFASHWMPYEVPAVGDDA